MKKIIIFTLTIIGLTTINSCKKEETPTVDFSYFLSSTESGKVNFTNNSRNFTSASWEFGDGSTSSSSFPSHSYTKNGTYNVTLKCFNSGKSNSISKNVDVNNVNEFSFYLTGAGTNQYQFPNTYAYKTGSKIGITAKSSDNSATFQIFLPYPPTLFHEYTENDGVVYTYSSTTGVFYAGTSYSSSSAKITVESFNSSRISGIFSGQVTNTGGSYYIVTSGKFDLTYTP